MEEPHSASRKAILERILTSPHVDLDGFRMSLWSGFYTNPVFVDIERRFGLLRDENNILFCLVNYGELTAKSICDVLGRPKNSISRAVERLIRRGLVRRGTDEKDRRKGPLSVEPAGAAIYAETAKLFLEREALMLRNLSPTERVALDRILGKLMEACEDWMGPAEGT